MELSRLFLRIMLWSLGFAAVSGVGAVLLGSGDLPWRVVATGVVTAIASGLLIPLSILMDREMWRQAGLLGMAGVIIEFLMALLIIWEIPYALLLVRIDREIVSTSVSLAAVIPPTMLFLRLGHAVPTKRAAQAAVVLCSAVLIALVTASWTIGGTGRLAEQWADTAGVLALFGLLVVACLLDVQPTPWLRGARWLGALAAACAATMWLWNIWIGTGSDLGTVIFTGLTGVGAVCAHASLSALCPLLEGQRWLLWGTLLSAIATALLADALIIEDRFWHLPQRRADLLARGTAAAGILAGCGTLALIVLARLNRRMHTALDTAEFAAITLICPRCGKKQEAAVGTAHCVRCRLQFHVRLEAPRCPQCDYLLFGLSEPRCPECGHVLD